MSGTVRTTSPRTGTPWFPPQRWRSGSTPTNTRGSNPRLSHARWNAARQNNYQTSYLILNIFLLTKSFCLYQIQWGRSVDYSTGQKLQAKQFYFKLTVCGQIWSKLNFLIFLNDFLDTFFKYDVPGKRLKKNRFFSKKCMIHICMFRYILITPSKK